MQFSADSEASEHILEYSILILVTFYDFVDGDLCCILVGYWSTEVLPAGGHLLSVVRMRLHVHHRVAEDRSSGVEFANMVVQVDVLALCAVVVLDIESDTSHPAGLVLAMSCAFLDLRLDEG